MYSFLMQYLVANIGVGVQGWNRRGPTLQFHGIFQTLYLGSDDTHFRCRYRIQIYALNLTENFLDFLLVLYWKAWTKTCQIVEGWFTLMSVLSNRKWGLDSGSRNVSKKTCETAALILVDFNPEFLQCWWQTIIFAWNHSWLCSSDFAFHWRPL